MLLLVVSSFLFKQTFYKCRYIFFFFLHFTKQEPYLNLLWEILVTRPVSVRIDYRSARLYDVRSHAARENHKNVVHSALQRRTSSNP